MKLLSHLALALMTAAFLHSQLSAGDKKKDADKKPAPDIVVNGELINADLKDKVHTQSYAKTYTFKMEKDKFYQISLVSKDFPVVLRLEDASGGQIDSEIARFGGANVFYRCTKTDDVQIVATSQNGGAKGKFTLTIKEIIGDDGKPIELKNDNGKAAAKANLLKTDPVYKAAGKKHKMFLFEMTAGKTYQIDMTSGVFDSYLYLESPEGKLLAQDDDGGGYPSARITMKAPSTGKHRIICTYFGGGASGEFNLSIRQTD
jgi:hypothetical protein